jgi:hypothetical protein
MSAADSTNFCVVCLTERPDARLLGTCKHVCCDVCLCRLPCEGKVTCPLCRGPVFWATQWDDPSDVVPVASSLSLDVLSELMKPGVNHTVDVHRVVARHMLFFDSFEIQNPTTSEFVGYLCDVATEKPGVVFCWQERVSNVCSSFGFSASLCARWFLAASLVLRGVTTAAEAVGVVTELLGVALAWKRKIELGEASVEAKQDFDLFLSACEKYPNQRLYFNVMTLAEKCSALLMYSPGAAAKMLALGNSMAWTSQRCLFKAMRWIPTSDFTEDVVSVALELYNKYLHDTTEPCPSIKFLRVLIDVPVARTLLAKWFVGPSGHALVWAFDRAMRETAIWVLCNLVPVVDEPEFWDVVVEWLCRVFTQDYDWFKAGGVYLHMLFCLLNRPTPNLCTAFENGGRLLRVARRFVQHFRRTKIHGTVFVLCIDRLLALGVDPEVFEMLAPQVLDNVVLFEAGDGFEVVMRVVTRLLCSVVFREWVSEHWTTLLEPFKVRLDAKFAQDNAKSVAEFFCELLAREPGVEQSGKLVTQVFSVFERCFVELPEGQWLPLPPHVRGAITTTAIACLNAGGFVDKFPLMKVLEVLLPDFCVSKVVLSDEPAGGLTLLEAIRVHKPDCAGWLVGCGGFYFLGALLHSNPGPWCEIAVEMLATVLAECTKHRVGPPFPEFEEWLFVAPLWVYISRALSGAPDSLALQVKHAVVALRHLVPVYVHRQEVVSAFGLLGNALEVWKCNDEVALEVAAAMTAGLKNNVFGVALVPPVSVSTMLDLLSLHHGKEQATQSFVELLYAVLCTAVSVPDRDLVKRAVWTAIQGIDKSPAIIASLKVPGLLLECPSEERATSGAKKRARTHDEGAE